MRSRFFNMENGEVACLGMGMGMDMGFHFLLQSPVLQHSGLLVAVRADRSSTSLVFSPNLM